MENGYKFQDLKGTHSHIWNVHFARIKLDGGIWQDIVMDAVRSWNGGSNKERERYICEALEKLPPMYPERKSDEWIEASVAGMPALYHEKCNTFVYAPNGKKGFNFCPNCGAKMEGKPNE